MKLNVIHPQPAHNSRLSRTRVLTMKIRVYIYIRLLNAFVEPYALFLVLNRSCCHFFMFLEQHIVRLMESNEIVRCKKSVGAPHAIS